MADRCATVAAGASANCREEGRAPALRCRFCLVLDSTDHLAVKTWLIEMIGDDENDLGDESAVTLAERLRDWGDQAWAAAGDELERHETTRGYLAEAELALRWSKCTCWDHACDRCKYLAAAKQRAEAAA